MVPLTRDILVQFAEEQSWMARARTVERVATRYADGGLVGLERHAALDLFRMALGDGEPLVRRILAESIKCAPDLPHDIVRTLLQDIPEVSAPFLAASPLLADEDLLAIAKAGATAQRAAIACRPTLSERVARVLFGRTAAA